MGLVVISFISLVLGFFEFLDLKVYTFHLIWKLFGCYLSDSFLLSFLLSLFIWRLQLHKYLTIWSCHNYHRYFAYVYILFHLFKIFIVSFWIAFITSNSWFVFSIMSMLCYAKSLQSCPTLCDPIDGSHQAPLSLGLSRQEQWSRLPFPSPTHESEKWKRSHSVVSNS